MKTLHPRYRRILAERPQGGYVRDDDLTPTHWSAQLALLLLYSVAVACGLVLTGAVIAAMFLP